MNIYQHLEIYSIPLISYSNYYQKKDRTPKVIIHRILSRFHSEITVIFIHYFLKSAYYIKLCLINRRHHCLKSNHLLDMIMFQLWRNYQLSWEWLCNLIKLYKRVVKYEHRTLSDTCSILNGEGTRYLNRWTPEGEWPETMWTAKTRRVSGR